MNLKNYKINEIKIYYKITTEKTQSRKRSQFIRFSMSKNSSRAARMFKKKQAKSYYNDFL